MNPNCAAVLSLQLVGFVCWFFAVLLFCHAAATFSLVLILPVCAV